MGLLTLQSSNKVVADPGFPVGGGGDGATSDVGAFEQKHVRIPPPVKGERAVAPWIRHCKAICACLMVSAQGSQISAGW